MSTSSSQLRGTFIGDVSRIWQSGTQRLHCMRELGVVVRAIDMSGSEARNGLGARTSRLLNKESFLEEGIVAYNRLIQESFAQDPGDFAWIEWPWMMQAATLKSAKRRWPNCSLICFQDDNPFGDRAGARAKWEQFNDNISLYDVHFVKRISDVGEFTKRGAHRVERFMHGVYQPLFRPSPSSVTVCRQVSFVGTALDHRVEYLSQLLGRHRLPVHAFGGKWRKTWPGWRHWRHFSPHVNGEAYVRTIWESAISLGFVSSSNRDEYTMRSFEIPGSGGFFLAERTPTHQQLYKEGEEAEFFNSVDECADKISFYLKHDAARQRIACAGYARCQRSDYSLTSRMRAALSCLFPAQFSKM